MPQKKRKRDENNSEVELPGWPSYRTRSNRSGLDPLDTRSEAAHMQGVFLRNIFTLRARTRNPFYLILMFVFGVVPFMTILLFLLPSLPELDLPFVIYLVLVVLILGAVTINFLLSILEILRIISPLKPSGMSRAREIKKKLPKRRKDHR